MCSPSKARYNRGMDLEHVGKMISKDKKIALGVISHRTLQVERPEEVAGLIRTALKHIDPERLILTSDCGFGRQSMSRMHAFYKMVALTRGTNIVRQELGIEEAHIPGNRRQLSMVPLTHDRNRIEPACFEMPAACLAGAQKIIRTQIPEM